MKHGTPITLTTYIGPGSVLLGVAARTLEEAFKGLQADKIADVLASRTDGEVSDLECTGRHNLWDGRTITVGQTIALYGYARRDEIEAQYYTDLDTLLATGLTGEPFTKAARRLDLQRAARLSGLKRQTGRRW